MLLKFRMWMALAGGDDRELMSWSLEDAEPANGFSCGLIAGHAAIWGRDLVRARSALAGMIGTGIHGRWVSTVRANLHAGIASLEGRHEAAAAAWKEVQTTHRILGTRFSLALALMDQVALSPDPRAAEDAAREAAELLRAMGASALEQRLELLRVRDR